MCERLFGARFALLRQAKTVCAGKIVGRAADDLAHAVALQGVQQLHDVASREADDAGYVLGGGSFCIMDDLDDMLEQERRREADFLNGLRRLWQNNGNSVLRDCRS